MLTAAAKGKVVTFTWKKGAAGGAPLTYVVVYKGRKELVDLSTTFSFDAAPGRYLVGVFARNTAGDSPLATAEVIVLGLRATTTVSLAALAQSPAPLVPLPAGGPSPQGLCRVDTGRERQLAWRHPREGNAQRSPGSRGPRERVLPPRERLIHRRQLCHHQRDEYCQDRSIDGAVDRDIFRQHCGEPGNRHAQGGLQKRPGNPGDAGDAQEIDVHRRRRDDSSPKYLVERIWRGAIES